MRHSTSYISAALVKYEKKEKIFNDQRENEDDIDLFYDLDPEDELKKEDLADIIINPLF
jgi:hypothetical protein